MKKQRITILGSTGSIGESTLSVIALHPDRYQVFALTAHTQKEKLFQQARIFLPKFIVIKDAEAALWLKQQIKEAALDIRVLVGSEALNTVASADAVDVVMAAIVGGAGLESTMAAAKAGKKILLANKESLIMAGNLLIESVQQSGAILLPVDSEHNAIFQCLPIDYSQQQHKNQIKKILLTGSGGPFRTRAIESFSEITPEEACNHPNWDMGRKISVDSATMMNKGLEFIEACWLFALKPDQIEIVIHPESIIHSMVEYVDGSVLAQMGLPDMRTPIAHALAWPERIDSGVNSLNMTQLSGLHFEAPDLLRFPALSLAKQAMEKKAGYAIALNAANEEAVAEFLQGNIRFTDILKVVQHTFVAMQWPEPKTLSDVLLQDKKARAESQAYIDSLKDNNKMATL